MNDKIRKYVNELFENAPNTKRAYDLKDEIISNANDKYNDLISEGKSVEEAYNQVIQEIGNVDELINELVKNNPINKESNMEAKRKTALTVSISIGIYILSVISVIVLDELRMPDFITASSFLALA